MDNRGCYIKYKNPSGYFCWIENFTNLKYKICPWHVAYKDAQEAEALGHKATYYHHGSQEVLHMVLDDKDGHTCHYLLNGETYLLNNSGGTIEVLKKKV